MQSLSTSSGNHTPTGANTPTEGNGVSQKSKSSSRSNSHHSRSISLPSTSLASLGIPTLSPHPPNAARSASPPTVPTPSTPPDISVNENESHSKPVDSEPNGTIPPEEPSVAAV